MKLEISYNTDDGNVRFKRMGNPENPNEILAAMLGMIGEMVKCMTRIHGSTFDEEMAIVIKCLPMMKESMIHDQEEKI